MLKPRRRLWLFPVFVLLSIGVYSLPPVHSRLVWRVEMARTQIRYFFHPPAQAAFLPTQQAAIEAIVRATMQAYRMTTPTATPTPRPAPTFSPTPTATPLPMSVSLPGVKYEDQHNRWNYCGPASFSMALRFWGWNGNRDVIGKALMPANTGQDGLPANKDKNVMPYEFQDYITDNVPGLTSVLRYGGDVDVLQRLVAGGFPVLAEKGYYERDVLGKVSWMGHYQFITGYNAGQQSLLVQDTYLDGANFPIPYEKFMDGWRAFNYLFMVVYPLEREAEVMSLLGPYADADWAARHALEVAQAEAQSLSGPAQFFAWFNVGTSHVALREYVDAGYAYDLAFQTYAGLPADEKRPFRMMWYQTGPYWAYFYSARYQDVINLANTTLSLTPLEESLLWRGRAESALGDTNAALADYRAALKVHPNWGPALQALQDLGKQP